jgi:hypothetical protein
MFFDDKTPQNLVIDLTVAIVASIGPERPREIIPEATRANGVISSLVAFLSVMEGLNQYQQTPSNMKIAFS